MELKETLLAVIKELVMPEVNHIKEENREIKTILSMMDKRLNDINLHLADQSRRIDDTNKRIDSLQIELSKRIDDTNKRIDSVQGGLSSRIEALHIEFNRRIDAAQSDLIDRIDKINTRIDGLSMRIDETNHALLRFFDVIVRKEEHAKLVDQVGVIEREVREIKRLTAA